jgi:hypothetical protein
MNKTIKIINYMDDPSNREFYIMYSIAAAAVIDMTKIIRKNDPDAVSETNLASDKGAIQLYVNSENGEKFLAVLYLGIVEKNHYLDDQLNKVKNRVSNDVWKYVLQQLSKLIFVARSGYSKISRNIGMTKYNDLSVDLTNTTLFVDENWNQRLGIMIDLK